MLDAWVAVQRLFFTILSIGAVVLVVGDAAVDLWNRGSEIWAVAAVVFFPVTFLVWPWTHEAFGLPLWIAFIVGFLSQSIIRAWDRSHAHGY